MAVAETIPLEQRLNNWFEQVDRQQKSRLPVPEKLLTEGYELFFATIDPFKDTPWMRATYPSYPNNNIVFLVPGLHNRLGEFSNLFGEYHLGWGVQIYRYREGAFSVGEVDAKIKLTCNSSDPSHSSKKLIEVFWSPRYDQGQMRLEDTATSWLRADKHGVINTYRDRNLHDYAGLSVCKLVVATGESFTEKMVAKQKDS